MNSQQRAIHKNSNNPKYGAILALSAVAVNVILSYTMYRMGLPFFLDSAGTIAVSALTGMLYAGIFTAVVTNVICSFFNDGAVYFAFFNALLAIYTVWFVRKYSFRQIGKTILFALSVIFLSAAADAFSQYALFGEEEISVIAQNAHSFAAAANIPYFLSFCVTILLMNVLDKGSSIILVTTIIAVVPKEKLAVFQINFWKQKALTKSELKSLDEWRRDIKISLRTRNTLTIVITTLLLVLFMGWIGTRLYFTQLKEDKIKKFQNLIKIASEVIPTDKIDEFIKDGFESPAYQETYSMLYKLWEASGDRFYLYVVRIENQGVRFVFDISSPDSETEALSPGQLVPFDKEFEEHLPDLFAGREIEPVEEKNLWGWLVALYYPVKDSSGKCVCYVGADVLLNYMAGYVRIFILKVFMTLAGFFILVIAYALWTTGIYTSYPISTMASCVDRFAKSGEDQEKLDENVKIIRSIDIQTGDEVEKLYHAICRMTLNQAEQMRDIRRLSDSTAKMQDGLIITMADMVESRDSDTGAHVQKTAAYVKIIVEGLKKKGYYAQKITPKFMSDVVRSAPLHDVGKINIPDGVLNKPGKLTDEEFAIMKTHTTAGKKILENAISTVQGENYLKEARNMAAYHHERWDGKGYPEGLHGEVIPLSARIMAVADVFDALASPRVYKPAFPIEKALAILQEGAGTQFDAKCVEVFMDALPEVKLILKKYNPGAL